MGEGDSDDDDDGSVNNGGSELTVDSTTTDGDMESEFGSPAPSSVNMEEGPHGISQSQTITSTTADHNSEAGGTGPMVLDVGNIPPHLRPDIPSHCPPQPDLRKSNNSAAGPPSSGGGELTSLTPVKPVSAPLMVS